jgi:hypothetical protein
VNVYPFIGAEQAGRRSVKRACELMKVSRYAYYQYTRGDRSPRGWYNTRRRHSGLGYLSPAAYETSASNVA